MTGQKKTVHFLMQSAQGKKRYIALLGMLQMILGVGGVFWALCLRTGIDAAVNGHGKEFEVAMTLFVLVILVQIVSRYLVRYLEEYLKSGLENGLKQEVFGRLLSGTYAKVTAKHSGEWMARLTSDTGIVADGMTTILPGILGMSLRLAAALTVLVAFLPEFGLFLIAGGGILLVFTAMLRKPLKAFHRKIQDADAGVRVFLQEHLGSLMILKVYRAEREAGQEAGERMRLHKKARMRRNHWSNFCNTGFLVMIYGIYFLGVFVCGRGILQGTVSYGTLVAVLQLIGQLQQPLAGMTGFGPRFYAMLSSAERLMEAEAVLAEQEQKRIQTTFGSLEAKHVTFSYPDRDAPVLSDVSVRIERGECVAVTGRSGCGKSTLLKLLLGLYPVTEGTITVTGDEGEETVTEAHRGWFAYVPQGNHLMSGTIRDIVSLGNREEKENTNRLLEVLGIACAGFVFDLPDGIDTEIGENGAGLSEGQLQRLSIARALFSNREVLILDEGTSALDVATERRILENLRNLKEKTVLLVTHRPAALEVCDRIIDMEQFAGSERQGEIK